MAVSPGFRIGAIALLVVLAAVLGLVLLTGSSDDADAAPGERTPARQLLLAPSDLPQGYEYFSPDFDGQPNPNLHCAAINPEDSTDAVEVWIAAYAPRGCYALFYRFRGHSEETFRIVPPLVATGALDAGSTEGAEAGLALAPILLVHALDEPLAAAKPAPAGPGEEAVFIRFQSGFTDELSGGGARTSVLVWRSGDTLGAVLVGGLSAKANDRKALVYAKRQQQRIAAP